MPTELIIKIRSNLRHPTATATAVARLPFKWPSHLYLITLRLYTGAIITHCGRKFLLSNYRVPKCHQYYGINTIKPSSPTPPRHFRSRHKFTCCWITISVINQLSSPPSHSLLDRHKSTACEFQQSLFTYCNLSQKPHTT